MTASAVIGIISAVLGLARAFVDLAQQRKWIEAGAAETMLKGLKDADAAVAKAREARQAARLDNARDPAGVLRDDDGFKRPD